jgi:hypothetical protein
VQGVGAPRDSTDVHPVSGRPPPLLSRLLSKRRPLEAGSGWIVEPEGLPWAPALQPP